ncbi:MAG TPA: 50S ribosomal protein L34e [Candidatus Nanoarchaeia archaeon]|nr:50S ribosomal protein L34e [Candidatus Nanoarchaeia archaeon]
MVEGKKRSRSKRRVKVKLSKNTVIHYEDRKPKLARCGGCGTALKGVPRLKKSEISNIAKTKKRPERPFGGVLCSRCMREKMRARIMG